MDDADQSLTNSVFAGPGKGPMRTAAPPPAAPRRERLGELRVAVAQKVVASSHLLDLLDLPASSATERCMVSARAERLAELRQARRGTRRTRSPI
jgi:hypothetical protein